LELNPILELEKLNLNLIQEASDDGVDNTKNQQRLDDKEHPKIAKKLSLVATRSQTQFNEFESTSNVVATIIEDLYNKL
jgi:hypothetical protein